MSTLLLFLLLQLAATDVAIIHFMIFLFYFIFIFPCFEIDFILPKSTRENKNSTNRVSSPELRCTKMRRFLENNILKRIDIDIIIHSTHALCCVPFIFFFFFFFGLFHVWQLYILSNLCLRWLKFGVKHGGEIDKVCCTTNIILFRYFS